MNSFCSTENWNIWGSLAGHVVGWTAPLIIITVLIVYQLNLCVYFFNLAGEQYSTVDRDNICHGVIYHRNRPFDWPSMPLPFLSVRPVAFFALVLLVHVLIFFFILTLPSEILYSEFQIPTILWMICFNLRAPLNVLSLTLNQSPRISLISTMGGSYYLAYQGTLLLCTPQPHLIQ